MENRSISLFSMHGRIFGLLILSITLLLVSQSSFAAIAFRAESSNGIATAAGGLTINVPAGTITADVMIASIAWRQNNPAIVAPSGWTLVRETNQTNGGGASNRFASYVRVVTGSEPTSYIWNFSGGTFSGAVGAITTFSGVDTTNPIEVEGGNTTPNSFSHTANSVNTAVADTMIVSSHEFPSATSDWTSPSGMTEMVDAASIPRPSTVGIALSMNYVLQAGIGATGNKTADANPSGTDAGNGAAHILALRPSGTIPPASLIAYYTLDEASWNGIIGEVIDSSGNGLNGTALGGLSTAPAIVCRGGNFDGSNGPVNIPDHNLLDLSNELTVSAWIRPYSIPGSDLKSILSKDENYEYHVNSAGEIYWWWRDTSGNTRTVTSTGANILPDTSYHVAITYTSGSQAIYVNGIIVGSASYTGNLMTNSDPLQIGGDQGFSGREFDGLIDEARIYASALTQTEINADMLATHPCPPPTICDTFRDEFSTRSYNRNDGTVNWAGNWIETGDNGSASSGDIEISGNQLRLEGDGSGGSATFGGPSIEREADLSSYTSATLTFDYNDSGNWESNDNADIWVSSNGGINWTRIHTFTGNQRGGSQTFSHNITSYISSNFRVAFVERASRDNERFYIDNVQIEACTSGINLDHYLINHDGFGINCVTENITITAMDSNTPSAPIDPAGATITIDTQSSRGDWSLITGSGTLNNGAANDGVATYAFAAGETSVGFGLDYREGNSPITLAVSDGTASDDGTHGPLPFSPSGFTVTSSAIGNPPVIPVPPFDSQIAGTDFPIYITAYGVTPADPVCGVIEAYDGQRALQFWSGYDNPGSGTIQVSITDDNNTQSIGTAEGSATARSVTFTQGQAQVTGKYKDVGQITISMKDTSVADPNLPNGIRGGAQFVVRPNHFDIHSILCSDGTNNPAAADQNGARFCAAGEPFIVTIDAMDAEGDITPNYGQESVAEDVQLTANLIAPAGENNPAIAVLTPDPFSAGSSSPQISWSEVGIITLTPAVADNDYLGAGDVTGTTTGNIGRFYPFDFNVTLDNTPDLAPACSGFSYIGQDLLYNVAPQVTITARLSNGSGSAQIGSVTQNYDGVWWKLADFNESVNQDGGNPLPAGVALDSAAAGHSAIDCSSGTCDGTFTTTFNGQFLYTRSVAETVPFDGIIDISFPIDDGDAQYASNPFIIQDLAFSGGNNQQRSGRMAVFDVYGSELYALTLPVAVQYWEDVGTGVDYAFITASDDNCSTLATTDINLSNFSGNLGSGETSVTAAALASGAGTITLSAPGDGNEGGVDATVDLTAAGSDQPWLQFDWDGDSALDDNPTGHAIFGIYSGSEKQIYIRERY